MNKIDKDRLNGADYRKVAQGAMAVVTKLQDSPAEVQVLAAATVFSELVRRYKVHAGDALVVVGNMVNREGGVTPEFRAVRQYIERETR